MIPKGFQCKFAVASGQDGEPCCLEQLPDETLYMQIVFNKQNHHRVHINLFNGLKSVALQYDLVPSTPLNIRDRTFADCIVDPERLGCNRSIPTESTCGGEVNSEGHLRHFRFLWRQRHAKVTAIPKSPRVAYTRRIH